MLTDTQFKQFVLSRKISIEPYNEKNVKAGKCDVYLGRYLLIPKNIDQVIDPTDPTVHPEYEKIDLSQGNFILKPQQFVLAQTLELVGLSSDIGMFLDGSTTLARLGLTIHQTANYIPPGQDPHIITLELFNSGPWSINLVNEMRIGKLIAFKYSENNEIPAKDFNRYNGQKETTGAIIKPNNES